MTKSFYSISLFCWLTIISFFGQSQEKYQASIDLTKVENDQMKIEVKTPKLEGKNQLFVFPKVVPGTYEKYDFGRFVSSFRAFNSSGKKVRVKRNDVNSYKIKKAWKVASIEYYVDDTWDDFSGSHYVFQPGGTSIEANEEFVFNNFGFFGYFRNYPKLPYELSIKKPENLYGATSLDRIKSGSNFDYFVAENYVELVDQPILYAKPDTISYMEGGAKVGIAVYSPNEIINALAIKEVLEPLTKATSYVLGNIPTDEYWFLFHFFDFDNPVFRKGGGAYGALEHKKSSFYYLPLIPGEENGVDVESVMEVVSSVGAHEFLHILSPLNLHSEEISNFDFYETEMSEHLWLYEGVTEYLSNKSRVIAELISLDGFLDETEAKIKAASMYKEISFTEMSKNILDKEMNRQYGNVYQKGALIAMLLDILIAEETNGEKDLINIVLELIDDYGMKRAFKDEELFDAIAAKTSPVIRDFFSKYVEGNTPLPYEQVFDVCGLNYVFEAGNTEYSFGGINIAFDSEGGLLIVTPEEGNTYITKPLAISKLNGQDLTFRLVRKLLLNPDSGMELNITNFVDGKEEQIVLKPGLSKGDLEHRIELKDEMTEKQQMLFDRLFTKGSRE